MAAPETDVPARLGPNKTPVQLEELTKDDKLPPDEPRPPWKGVLVECAKLWSYLSGISTFERANMLRKGREVHKIYVEVMKGKTFLDDQFNLTEFGRMVLQNGTIRAGRAKNAKQIVVARETLYCSGSGACKRGCGGYGECIQGCEKTKMRGHKCSYRVKLTMRLGYVNFWFVEVLGDHEQFASLDSVGVKSSPSPKMSNSSSPAGSPSHVPIIQSPNSDLPNSAAITTASPLPQNLPNILTNALSNSLTSSLPNSLTTALSNNLPNIIASQPMSLPINLPNNIVSSIVSHPGLFASHAAAVRLYNGAGPCEVVYPSMEGIAQNYCQDMPISLVKVKKEPEEPQESGAEPHVSQTFPERTTEEGDLKNDSSMMTVTHSEVFPKISSGGRAKARKRFHPAQVMGQREAHRQMFTPTKTMYTPETATSIPQLNMESHVRKELRELVARREQDRNSSSSNFTSMNGQQEVRPVDYWPEATSYPNDEPSDSSMYTYVWDGDMNEPQVVEEDVTMETTNEEKDLITRVRQLETHVNQLRNVVLKSQGETNTKQSRKKGQREFDFKKYNTRHVALKVLYLGWDYHGFAAQEDTEKTIETALFEALLKTRLIEDRETSSYHRCGRTDKGVSAFGQVISIDLRTNLLEGPGVKVREDGTAYERPGEKTTEVRYVHILNKVLPPEIRILAWAPVNVNFSARFDCKKRTYKYFFPKGNLDIQAMSEAAEKITGEHDFRNLCKMDVGNGVVNFRRKIVSADIKDLDERENGYQMCELTIVGLAFLWHQIRCIVAVLYLIGQGKEKSEIIDELLDVEKTPRKPQYTMASELPLVLFDCEFADDVEWIYEADWHEENIRHLQQIWAHHTVRSTMIRRMLEEMDSAKVETDCDIAPWKDLSSPIYNQTEWIIPGNKSKVHKRLLERQTCDSLEQRIENYAKRRKLNTPPSTDMTSGSNPVSAPGSGSVSPTPEAQTS
ncbi:tRNA pseudouridine(38/39) synthase [Mizuhopecten yessoensis]|uniref:tRNA pseudouridine(38/39) synthase n=1 Tax=Mizuhopecten yessoensis TaxID=6573 RepID=A0A210Q5L0_MIZYE|nr:tRNA pseudouridine(38/39) synthase [Mizuhopecten yessoensis]